MCPQSVEVQTFLQPGAGRLVPAFYFDVSLWERGLSPLAAVCPARVAWHLLTFADRALGFFAYVFGCPSAPCGCLSLGPF